MEVEEDYYDQGRSAEGTTITLQCGLLTPIECKLFCTEFILSWFSVVVEVSCTDLISSAVVACSGHCGLE